MKSMNSGKFWEKKQEMISLNLPRLKLFGRKAKNRRKKIGEVRANGTNYLEMAGL